MQFIFSNNLTHIVEEQYNFKKILKIFEPYKTFEISLIHHFMQYSYCKSKILLINGFVLYVFGIKIFITFIVIT